MDTIGVIGAGAWGTALAQVLAKNGRSVILWAREPEVAQAVNTTHENTIFLPGVPLDPSLRATNDLQEVASTDILLLVSPAQHVRATLAGLKPLLRKDQPVVICAKGIELNTGLLLSQVAWETLGDDENLAILTGPTFADEIANGLPCAVTIAATHPALAGKLQKALAVKGFRPYITGDMVGAQLAAALKNVIAIAGGIVAGRKMGESARAALLTRGAAEIARLSAAMGGRADTMMGPCGIGDLFMTASSMKSRNFSLGFALGEGKTLEEILGPRIAVTEGVHTAKAALSLAKTWNVDMPISAAVNKVLQGETSIDEAIEDLLGRPVREEA
ncbi:MAG: NAD(P)-dependent glycerol-3-phosphate dehydrogenase [Alphaproteobacteria bacterium]|nr:NAD(P)-dependent glycerol-3-phosphate dehydrogenase [Alphaproteobacteria bacterium]